MKKIEIEAFSVKEAQEKAKAMGINIVRNITTTFANSPVKDFDEFANWFIDKNKLSDKTGFAFMIVDEQGSADSRLRPYKFENNFVPGKLSAKRVFEIYKDGDDTILATADSKHDAAEKAKELIKKHKTDLVCKIVYRVQGNHEKAFDLKYTPSKNTKIGKYTIFGNW